MVSECDFRRYFSIACLQENTVHCRFCLWRPFVWSIICSFFGGDLREKAGEEEPMAFCSLMRFPRTGVSTVKSMALYPATGIN